MKTDVFQSLKSQILLQGVGEVAAKSGVSRSRIYDFVQGTRALTTKNLGKIMNALELKIINAIPLESAFSAATKATLDGKWELHFFNFVDDFRRSKDISLISVEPQTKDPRLKALLTSIVEALCHEIGTPAPPWATHIGPLKNPWFVSGMENLKASALLESPLHFRKRNIFVLNNFLERA